MAVAGAISEEQLYAASDIADVPTEDLTVDGNDKMRYFLIGAGKDAEPPGATGCLPASAVRRGILSMSRRVVHATCLGCKH